MKKKILLIYTGGTIGMVKDKKKNTLIPFNFDKLLKAVPEINSEEIYLDNISTKNPIDSSNMNSDNWIEIVSLIENNYDSYDGFVVLHGTDTMANTAAVLASAKLNKTIVLTGAMIPYKFGASDAFFNLGNALAFVQVLPDGVYIAMNGRFFMWDNVQKNQSSGLFEEVNKGKENPLVGAKST